MTIPMIHLSVATGQLSPVGEALNRVGITSLLMQARARLCEQQPAWAATASHSAIGRAAMDTQTNLVAMSRYCLQQLLPRIHSLALQAETVANSVQALSQDEPDDIAARLGDIAAELDNCGIILRGHARSSLRVTGMIRMSEQRLWGALAAEMHRVEGTDGPMMRACAEVETLAFDLGQALDDLMEGRDEFSLSMRAQICDILIRVTSEDGPSRISDSERARLIELLCERLGDIRSLIENLTDQRRALQARSAEVGRAISIATEASAQSVLTGRLEDYFRDLDELFSEMSSQYRKLARKSGRPAGRLAAISRVKSDARDWRLAIAALREPMALCDGAPDPSVQLRNPPRRRSGAATALRA